MLMGNFDFQLCNDFWWSWSMDHNNPNKKQSGTIIFWNETFPISSCFMTWPSQKCFQLSNPFLVFPKLKFNPKNVFSFVFAYTPKTPFWSGQNWNPHSLSQSCALHFSEENPFRVLLFQLAVELPLPGSSHCWMMMQKNQVSLFLNFVTDVTRHGRKWPSTGVVRSPTNPFFFFYFFFYYFPLLGLLLCLANENFPRLWPTKSHVWSEKSWQLSNWQVHILTHLLTHTFWPIRCFFLITQAARIAKSLKITFPLMF